MECYTKIKVTVKYPGGLGPDTEHSAKIAQWDCDLDTLNTMWRGLLQAMGFVLDEED